jgi:hypothetical protein
MLWLSAHHLLQRIKQGWFDNDGVLTNPPAPTADGGSPQPHPIANHTSQTALPANLPTAVPLHEQIRIANQLYDTATSKTIARQTKSVLRDICRLRLSSDPQQYDRMKKNQMIDLIEQSVSIKSYSRRAR